MLELGCGLLIAQREYDAAEEISTRAQAIQSVLVQRDPAGIAPLLENRAIEARVVVFQRAAAQARQRLLAALQEINLLRGTPPDAQLTLAEGRFDFRRPGRHQINGHRTAKKLPAATTPPGTGTAGLSNHPGAK